MISTNPVNIELMNVDKFIQHEKALPVTSHHTFDTNGILHPEGLFSEVIFGQIGSDERLIRFGYIDLNTKILNPVVYRNLLTMKKMYNDVMCGKTTVKFSKTELDLVLCDKDDPDGGTGYGFFMNQFSKLKFKETKSTRRSDKISIIENSKDALFISRIPVIPAGIRDIQDKNGRPVSEDINKIYQSILSLGMSLPSDLGTHPIFDSVRFALQLKVVEVYEYLKNVFDGKEGYGQSKYNARSIACGTRNVISAPILESEHPKSPNFLKVDETLVPLFEVLKMYQPAVVYQLKNKIFNYIFGNSSSNTISAIDPATNKLSFIEITDDEKNRFTTSEGIDNFINLFINEFIRERPVTIKNINDKQYYLLMLYDDGDEIFIYRSLADFTFFYKENYNKEIDNSKIRACTFIEMMYLTAYPAMENKHVFFTRYPVTTTESIYPSKCHIATTSPSRMVKLISQYDTTFSFEYPEYPILNNKYIDAASPHTGYLAILGADFDGDTGSINGTMMNETNIEINNYLSKKASVIDSSGRLISGISGGDDTLIPWVLYNMSRTKLPQVLDISQFNPTLSRIKYIDKFIKMMPLTETIVLGSSFLVLCGLIPENTDIDFITTTRMMDIFSQSPTMIVVKNKNSYTDVDTGVLDGTDTLMGKNFDYYIDDVVTFNGVQFLSPKHSYQFYKQMNRPKDQEKIKLYEQYFSSVL